MRTFLQRWLGEERLPFLFALTEPWAYTAEGELSRVSRTVNRWRRLTRWLRWSWWKTMLEWPAKGTEPYLTVVLCRMRGHAPRIFYNAGGMEPDDRCSRCLEEY